MFKRCTKCNKLMVFKYNDDPDGYFCDSCLEKKKAEEEMDRQVKRARELKRKQQRAKKKNEIANQKLKKELEREKRKQAKKQDRKYQAEKKKHIKEKEPPKTIHKTSPTRSKIFDKKTIDSYSRLLYVEADVKHIKVIDWRDGKKKVMLNKNREVRRTHAGGFSAEKFQKFVDAKKNKTFEWIVEQLSRPGILRPPYDKIKVESKDEELKREIEGFITALIIP